MSIDASSRLKQFIWEELEDNFYIAVLFRSGRRVVVQRHFEQQLFDIKSRQIQMKWRQCIADFVHQSKLLPMTRAEVDLMHDIFSWHLNIQNPIRLKENLDYVIDFEDLLDSYQTKDYSIQSITTLDQARKTIESYQNQNFQEKPTTTESGWIQLDSKITPFIKKYRDHLLPVEYLIREHLISADEDFALKSLYIPMTSDDRQLFEILFNETRFLDSQSSLITLDHLIFRLKRLFFIRFLSSSKDRSTIDYKQIMLLKGGLITLNHSSKQCIPFIYINKQKYIPQITFDNSSTFCLANQMEFEYLRLITLYDYLATDEQNEYYLFLSKQTNLTLIPSQSLLDSTSFITLSLKDFHSHEYQRRTQQEKHLFDASLSDGWWQPPRSSSSSSSSKKSLSHLKIQQPIFF